MRNPTELMVGGCKVEPSLNLIDGERVEPKAMDVLLTLVDAAPQPVAAEQLLNEVWRETVVVDNVVHKAVARLRRVFGDSSRESQFIETVPRRGYRLIATIERGETTAADVSLASGSQLPQPIALGPESSIAVLPFKNLSDDESQRFFVQGMTEDVRNGLGNASAIRVIGRASSFQFDGDAIDIVEVGKLLGVTHVVQGGVRRFGDRVRVTATLTSTADGTQLWSNQYDRELADVFAVQDEISGSILEALHFYLVPPSRVRTNSLAAYAAYVEGRCLQYGGMTRRADLAEAAFERALALDPSYADAHAAIAGVNASTLFARTQTIPNALPRIQKHLSAALDADPDCQEAYETQIMLRFFVERDYQGAIDSSVQALQEKPNSMGVYLWLTLFFRAIDRNDLMLSVARRLVSFDPLNVVYTLRLAEDLIWAGSYDEALSAAYAVEKRGYRAAHLIFNVAYRTGDDQLLIKQIDRSADAWDSEQRRLLYLAEFARDSGDAAALEKYVDQLRPLAQAERRGIVGASNLRPLSASVALLEGDPNPALDWLEPSITTTPQGIWLAPAGPCRPDQPRGIDLDRKRYPELYAHPDRERILKKYGIDRASILKITVPELPP